MIVRASILAAAISLAGASTARADEPTAPAPADRPPPGAVSGPRPILPVEEPWLRDAATEGRAPLFSDPVAVASLTNLVLGGVMVVIGAPLWGTATTSEHVCGKLAGCFDSNEVDEPSRDGGAALTGLGLGFAATGGIALGILAADPKGVRAERNVRGLATAGTLLMGLSFGSLLGGITLGAMLDDAGVSDPYTSSWSLFMTSGLAATLGVPFLAAGAPFASIEDKTKRRLHGRPELLDPVPRSVIVGPRGVSAVWAF
ncbi:MAG: hypothetical protein U0414_03375 [Polyangiaceae bacterium]